MTTLNLRTVLLVPSCLLLIPLAAMVGKVEGWAWGPFDFVAAWVLMAGVGCAYRFVTMQAGGWAYRAATAVALGGGLMLVWINGAVGLIGSEDNPANRLYGGVLLVGVIGAVVARLKPVGMARAMGVMAFAQLMVPLLALIYWRSDFSPGVGPVLGLNFFFVLLFAGSAWLFRHASRGTGARIG